MNTIQEIASVLKRLKSAVIFTHMRPDGDALGSAVALSRALFLCKIETQIVNEGEIPAKFLCFEGMDRIVRTPTLDADGYICVDSAELSRLGEAQAIFTAGARKGKVTVNIDHHISNPSFCKYNFVRPRSSNCENIAALIRALGVVPDRVIADALMIGMITDSGAFSHSDVNGDTFREAAFAADAGANVNRVSYEICKKQSRARAELYASTIAALRFELEGALAIAVVPRAALEQRGLGQDATEGIVSFALTIDCVEVSLCLMEVKRGQYKASFRSKSMVNVNEVAGLFGGGGHILASGCMLFGDIEEIIDRVRYAVAQRLPQ